MATFSNSHFTPLTFLYFLLFFSSTSTPILSLNITTLLSSYPDLSDFTSLLSSTSVAADLTHRSSLTLLVVPNSFLHSSHLTHHPNLPDILRYHVLLQYLSSPDLHQFPPTGKLVTTLFQTTGRATANFGSVNITRNPTTNAVAVRSPDSNATVLSLIKTLPYNVSIFSINSLLIPYGFDLMASETQPPLGLNITKALIDGHDFNVAASILTASGVVGELERDEGGAGITIFVPTVEAFSDLRRRRVSNQSIVNPVQPTLATEGTGAGRFTLNISRVNGSVAIDTGIVRAAVARTVFDQNPLAIFGVSKVLLPREYFGKNPIVNSNKPVSDIPGVAQPPEISLPPEISPPSHLSSPPGFREEIRSESARNCVQSLVLCLGCIALYLLV
ncbi:Fasciclin-like arabinogalactan protein 4 [Camellia lanceoleosa]|uniref:Fasciclin-like arabinogalactan protein 4 n=1 Tax=Camellia lanceoleosa TaxID=1840588 RepID=A0ACC0F740_9ERIC|nr:Fasciclin-like arabinogalactan protein 4 [Camellia lanceoleosa]